MGKVLITARSFSRSGPAQALLKAHHHDIIWNPQDRPLTEAELFPLVAGLDAVIAGVDPFTGRVIEAAGPALKIIAKYGVGYDNIDMAAASRLGIPVTVTPGANTVSVAELAFSLMLAAARQINQMDRTIRSGSWSRVTGSELDGKTLGIIGLGSIGCEVAKRALAFGMKIIAYDTFQRQEFIDRYQVKYLPLPVVLAQADILSLHAPAIKETIGMINQSSIRTMKPGVILVNTARGDLIVEEDLCDALESGHIAAAGLDTFLREPLPPDSRLLKLNNVILTPHAGAATKEASAKMAMTAAEEVVRVLSGKAPLYQVKSQLKP